MRNFVMIAPKTEPMGKMPIKIDWAEKELTDVML